MLYLLKLTRARQRPCLPQHPVFAPNVAPPLLTVIRILPYWIALKPGRLGDPPETIRGHKYTHSYPPPSKSLTPLTPTFDSSQADLKDPTPIRELPGLSAASHPLALQSRPLNRHASSPPGYRPSENTTPDATSRV